MSEDSVNIAKLQVERHNHANTLQQHAGKLTELEAKSNATERDMGVVQTEVSNLSEKVTTGFLDLKEVIVHRAEQDAEDRKRQHELAVTAASDRRALYMKVLGLVATALTIAGGGGGILYSMSADESPHPHHEPAVELGS
jgi:chromosome segregation ATPase